MKIMCIFIALLKLSQAHHDINDTCHALHGTHQSGTALYEPTRMDGHAQIPNPRQFALMRTEVAPSKMVLVQYLDEQRKKELLGVKNTQKLGTNRKQKANKKIRTNSSFHKHH